MEDQKISSDIDDKMKSHCVVARSLIDSSIAIEGNATIPSKQIVSCDSESRSLQENTTSSPPSVLLETEDRKTENDAKLLDLKPAFLPEQSLSSVTQNSELDSRIQNETEMLCSPQPLIPCIEKSERVLIADSEIHSKNNSKPKARDSTKKKRISQITIELMTPPKAVSIDPRTKKVDSLIDDRYPNTKMFPEQDDLKNISEPIDRSIAKDDFARSSSAGISVDIQPEKLSPDSTSCDLASSHEKSTVTEKVSIPSNCFRKTKENCLENEFSLLKTASIPSDDVTQIAKEVTNSQRTFHIREHENIDTSKTISEEMIETVSKKRQEADHGLSLVSHADSSKCNSLHKNNGVETSANVFDREDIFSLEVDSIFEKQESSNNCEIDADDTSSSIKENVPSTCLPYYTSDTDATVGLENNQFHQLSNTENNSSKEGKSNKTDSSDVTTGCFIEDHCFSNVNDSFLVNANSGSSKAAPMPTISGTCVTKSTDGSTPLISSDYEALSRRVDVNSDINLLTDTTNSDACASNAPSTSLSNLQVEVTNIGISEDRGANVEISNDPADLKGNSLRWAMCTKTARTLSVRCSLNILWSAWKVHSNFSDLEAWVLEAFEWNKGDLVNKVGPITVSQLRAAHHPENLTEDAALQVIRYLIPDLPPPVLDILERIAHLPMTACYEDVTLSNSQLDNQVQKIIAVVQPYLYSIHQLAQTMIASSVRRKIASLKEAKKSYKEAKRHSVQQNHVLNLPLGSRMSINSSQRSTLRGSPSVSPRQPFKSVLRGESAIELFNFRQSSMAETDSLNDNCGERSFDDTKLLLSNDDAECAHWSDAPACQSRGISNPIHLLGKTSTIERAHSLHSHDAPTRAERMISAQIERSRSVLTDRTKRIAVRASAKVDLPAALSQSDDSLDDDTEYSEDRSLLSFKRNNRFDLVQSQSRVKILRGELKTYRNKIGPFISFVEYSIHQTLESIRMSVHFKKEDRKHASEFMKFIRDSDMGKHVRRVRQAMQEYIRRNFKSFDMWQWLNSSVYRSCSVIEVSPLRIIHKYSSAKFSLDQILLLTEHSKYLSLVGPIGSGKSFSIKYLLNNWVTSPEAVNCPFDYDLLIPVTSGFFATAQSLEDYIAEILGCYSSSDLLHEITLNHVQKMKILFLAEIDVSVNIDKLKCFIDEMDGMSSQSRLLFTCRNEICHSIETLLVDRKKEIDALEILCLDDSLLFEFVEYYIVEEAAKFEFCAIYESLNLEANMRHPLFVLLSLFLWCKDPTFLATATCLSKLVMSIMVEFHLRASHYHNGKYQVEMESSNCWADDCVKELCESVWIAKNIGQEREEIYGLSEIACPSSESEDIFHPFLIFIEGHCYLAHPAFQEMLCGVYLAGKICKKKKKLVRCCCSKPDDDFKIGSRKLTTDCLIIAAGIWSLSEDLQQKTSDKLATLFATCAAGNPVQWLRFVGETGQSYEICSSVSNQLHWKPTWNAVNYGIQENAAVSELLRIEAYQPKKVVLNDNCSGIVELVSALAICPSISVILRLERHFFSWNERNESDDLVELLQPAGNLVELWGHLNVRGALAVRHMRRLADLSVRITSTDSLITLIETLPRIPSMKTLCMRLDIPKNVQPNIIPSMANFKGQFWLRLHKIEDASCSWALEITKAFKKMPVEIHLQNSWLSPNILNQFKVDVGNANVIIAL